MSKTLGQAVEGLKLAGGCLLMLIGFIVLHFIYQLVMVSLGADPYPDW